MTAAVPSIVMRRDSGWMSTTGTSSRRMVEIYLEDTPAIGETIDLATYVPNLSAITSCVGFTATGEFTEASRITWSGTTLTMTVAAAQFVHATGYYT
jgi:hypothetical protein